MESKTLQALKKYYWLIFLATALLILGLLSPLWTLPLRLLRGYPVIFITIALLLGGGLGFLFGLAHLLSQTLENVPPQRLKLVLYASMVLGMITLLLLVLFVMATLFELMYWHKFNARDSSHLLGSLAMFSWLATTFIIHALAGFRLSKPPASKPAVKKK